MTITSSLKKKLAAVAVLPLAASLTLAGCGDSTNDATNVNIQPIESEPAPSDTIIEPVETTPELPTTDGETTETTFVQDQHGVEMTLTYIAVGDRVIKQTTRNVIDYQAAGFADKAEAQEIFDPLLEEAADVKGYEQSMEYGETSAVEEVSIDYEVVDMTELHGIPGFEGSENMGVADFVSLSESRKLLEQQGFTVVE